MLTMSPMSLLEVRQAWGWIRNGLLTVIHKCHERWEPEDVWFSVMSGRSFVWSINLSGDDIGFSVVRRDEDVDGPVLFVWALWAEPSSLISCRSDLYDKFVDLARRIGARRIRYESSRNGWKWFGELFSPVRTTYEAEV